MSDVDDPVWSQLAALAPGWDSYGARPISPHAIYRAKRAYMLVTSSRPQIVPLSDGRVMLEWNNADEAVEIEVGVRDGGEEDSLLVTVGSKP